MIERGRFLCQGCGNRRMYSVQRRLPTTIEVDRCNGCRDPKYLTGTDHQGRAWVKQAT